jgi:hypothetical protein
MKKEDEVLLWRNLADKLPPESTYTGAWIREQIPVIESAMLSDMDPRYHCMSLSDHMRCIRDAENAHLARMEAQKKAAHDQGEAIIAAARKQADAIMSGVYSALSSAMRTIC